MDPDAQLEELQKRYRDLEIEQSDLVPVSIPKVINRSQEFCYVGVIFYDKDINEQAFIQTISQVWQPRYGVNIKHIGPDHRFLITFYHQKDFERAWKGSPWNFKNKLLALTLLNGQEDPTKVTVKHAPMWIQVFGVPVGYISTQVCEAVANFCGKLIEIDENNFKVIKPAFLKVRVLVDVSKPIKRRMRLSINGGVDVTVEFQYERLPSMCYICGMFEHVEDTCPIAYASNAPPKRMYDESIKAIMKPNMITAGSKWLRDENGNKLILTGSRRAVAGFNEMQENVCAQRHGLLAMEEDNVVELIDPKRKRGSPLADNTNSMPGTGNLFQVASFGIRACEEQ